MARQANTRNQYICPLNKNIFNRSKVITISSAHFVHDVYSSFLAPLLPLLLKKYGINLADASWLSLLQRIPSLFSVVLGTFAHKIPWRPIIILAPLLTAISGSLLGAAPNILLLGILLFTIGMSSAVFHVPAPVMIKIFSGSRAGKGMSFFIALTIYMLFRSVMRATLSTFLPTFMVGLKGSSLLFGAFSLSVLQATAVIGTFVSGSISDRIGRFNTLLILAIISPLFMFLFLWTGPLQIVSLLALGFVLAASTPVLLALVQEQGSNQPALMNGGFTTINFISGALSVLAAGYIGDAIGLEKTFQLSGLLAFIAIPAVFLLKKKSGQHHAETRAPLT